MKYEIKDKGRTRFEDVKTGSVFDTDDGFYIKIDNNSAFDIYGDMVVPFSYCTVVKVRDATLVIKE